MSDRLVWSNGEDGFRAVRVYPQRALGNGRDSIVVRVGNQQMAVSPTQAAEIASGVDHVLAHVDRNGQLKITAPAGSSKTSAPTAATGRAHLETEK